MGKTDYEKYKDDALLYCGVSAFFELLSHVHSKKERKEAEELRKLCTRIYYLNGKKYAVYEWDEDGKHCTKTREIKEDPFRLYL